MQCASQRGGEFAIHVVRNAMSTSNDIFYYLMWLMHLANRISLLFMKLSNVLVNWQNEFAIYVIGKAMPTSNDIFHYLMRLTHLANGMSLRFMK
ncbi:hypothetical protein GJ496_005203 [Pomphorhynchus laevis]|nr:hypothetical protein GJ496_005203 [Pomphorhynchus laevis]